MALPNFLCVGVYKAGTTTLHDILRQHSDICLPTYKETRFFYDDKQYNHGIAYYEKTFFKHWKGEKAIGEIDPDYIFGEHVPERLHKHLGKDIKLIFILRNPVDRAYSHYWMCVRLEVEKEGFEKAISLEQVRLKESKSQNSLFFYSYIKQGLYATQIKRYLQFFKKENMMFVLFEEDFIKNKQETIKDIINFLGLKYEPLNMDVMSNPTRLPRFMPLKNILRSRFFRRVFRRLVPFRKTRDKILNYIDELNMKPFQPEKIRPEFRKYLIQNYFLGEIKELEKIINRDLSAWLQ